MSRRLICVLALVACSGSSSPRPAAQQPAPPPAVIANPAPPDECETFAQKSRAVLDEDDRQIAAAMCRKDDEVRTTLVPCVLEAKDDAGVKECYQAMKREKKSEAEVNLVRIGKHAKAAYHANAMFPKGKSAQLPANRCCERIGGKCPATDEWTQDSVWGELGFVIVEPTHYQYAYESDGATFKATATADLDCDGETATWTLVGSQSGGNPTVILTQPPKGEY